MKHNGLDLVNFHFTRGKIAFKLKKYDLAFTEFAKTITLEQNHAEAHNNIGLTLLAQNQYTEALSAFETAIKLDPAGHKFNGYCNKAFTLECLGRDQEAIAAYDQSIAKRQEFTPSSSSQNSLRTLYEAYRNKAKLLVKLDRHGEAIENYAKAHDIYPDEKSSVADQYSDAMMENPDTIDLGSFSGQALASGLQKAVECLNSLMTSQKQGAHFNKDFAAIADLLKSQSFTASAEEKSPEFHDVECYITKLTSQEARLAGGSPTPPGDDECSM